MTAKRQLRALLCTAAALALLAAPGCGEDADGDRPAAGEASRAYAELLRGLRKAALADRRYGALRRAEDLSGAERAVVLAFCGTAWGVVINSEEETLAERPFIVARIRRTAEFELTGNDYSAAARAPYVAPVRAAIEELDEVVGLGEIDEPTNRRYKKACYA
ncbi:MAG TPA: hypothetical protein VHF50_03645 [Solirubrobacterales bacterium]|nr:hypothetical protein [Solirubrobacterales bacterium]